MPSASSGPRLAAAAVATLAVLALAAAGVVWRAGDADATAPHGAPAAQAAPAEPSTTSSTTAPSTTTSAPTTSTTSPRPVTTTTAPVRTTVARRAPVTTVPAPELPPTTIAPRMSPMPAATAEERCAAALEWVGQHGLALPAGWGFRCPGQALENGQPRWGIACWNCQGNGSWIAVDIGRIGASDATLRYVIAHEICHAIDYVGLGTSTEIGADLCAALHGAPRP